MGSVMDFVQNLDLTKLASLVISVVSALFCITWHEVSHGIAALKLGDPTAKRAGRLTLNPLKHLDPVGLLMMVVARVGWAKPVPIDPRYFKKPKRGIAITALAGPVSNFILSLLGMLLASLVYHLWYLNAQSYVSVLVMLLFVHIAVLSAGLGIFNLIPVPPLDGSKVLFALLPSRVYGKILKYERYGMIIMVALVFFGVLNTPLSYLILGFLRILCAVTGFPYSILVYLI